MISEVHNIDNMEFMASLPDKFFDLSIVDPPYGINAATGASTNGNMRKKIKSGKIKGGDWDKSIPDQAYFNELFRVSKHQIIWGGNYFDLPPTKCYCIWDKGESMYRRDFAECEYAWGSFDRCARIFKLFPNQLGRIHPTQKPVALYKWLLQNYAKKGDKIFDSHMGSQSSRLAACEMGFDYWGCELDKEYFEAGNKRFEEFKLQQRLFTPEQVQTISLGADLFANEGNKPNRTLK